jgi:hypothetical protein
VAVHGAQACAKRLYVWNPHNYDKNRFYIKYAKFGLKNHMPLLAENSAVAKPAGAQTANLRWVSVTTCVFSYPIHLYVCGFKKGLSAGAGF